RYTSDLVLIQPLLLLLSDPLLLVDRPQLVPPSRPLVSYSPSPLPLLYQYSRPLSCPRCNMYHLHSPHSVSATLSLRPHPFFPSRRSSVLIQPLLLLLSDPLLLVDRPQQVP